MKNVTFLKAKGLVHRPPPTTHSTCARELDRGIDRDKAVDAINTFRKELVNGKVQSKNAKFPKEEMAWEKVSDCSYRSSEDEEVGEAIHVVFRPSGGDFKPLDEPVKEALKDWVKRVENGYEDNSVSTCEFLGTYDEFIQVASGLTTDVGCATNPSCSFTENNNDSDEHVEPKKKKIKEKRHIQFTVCKFWPNGESFKKLYVKGKRCHRGWKCAKHGSFCNSDKLCEFGLPGEYWPLISTSTVEDVPSIQVKEASLASSREYS
ncbi:unnamed protein product [Dracunculus medinensis]|uniref:SCP domain-containing protein n=1 Tax=Dracunculus medinensis TaxID=318479 RepID=A0A0N4URK6_DRAME|nr:unnamed protein product [Dracunculus medinensis]